MENLYRTIIIDDEPPARKGMLQLLGNFPEIFEVVAMAENGTDAEEKIKKHKPDVVFLDIEMPGCTGFELLERLEVLPIVIFCTAYDEYSLKAFETHSIDYLVKPVELERLKKTVAKLKSFDRKLSSQPILKFLKEVSEKKEVKKMVSITVKKGDKLIFIKLDSISYFEADSNYVMIHSENGNYISEQSLANLEQKLPTNFLRVHRGIIINTDFVKEVQKYFNSRFVITLANNAKTAITTSRGCIDAVKNWMDI
jgi:two-component system LytT family response regulator